MGFFGSLMCVLSFGWRTLLTFQSQKELAINRNVTVSTIRHSIVETDAIASDVRNDAVNIPTIVSNIPRSTLKISEDARCRDLGVGVIRPLLVTE